MEQGVSQNVWLCSSQSGSRLKKKVNVAYITPYQGIHATCIFLKKIVVPFPLPKLVLKASVGNQNPCLKVSINLIGLPFPISIISFGEMKPLFIQRLTRNKSQLPTKCCHCSKASTRWLMANQKIPAVQTEGGEFFSCPAQPILCSECSAERSATVAMQA